MNCIHCNAISERDFPVCAQCAPNCHFTARADCRCNTCQDERNKAIIETQLLERRRLELAAWEEEGRLNYGWPVQAAA